MSGVLSRLADPPPPPIHITACPLSALRALFKPFQLPADDARPSSEAVQRERRATASRRRRRRPPLRAVATDNTAMDPQRSAKTPPSPLSSPLPSSPSTCIIASYPNPNPGPGPPAHIITHTHHASRVIRLPKTWPAPYRMAPQCSRALSASTPPPGYHMSTQAVYTKYNIIHARVGTRREKRPVPGGGARRGFSGITHHTRSGLLNVRVRVILELELERTRTFLPSFARTSNAWPAPRHPRVYFSSRGDRTHPDPPATPPMGRTHTLCGLRATSARAPGLHHASCTAPRRKRTGARTWAASTSTARRRGGSFDCVIGHLALGSGEGARILRIRA
ncbi:hypothetical protein BC628DRAFT_1044664 [Trametes gibbosa]|nr:hypothetical protein BC628DRAFT_1044664 [Trametes gibbosa]